MSYIKLSIYVGVVSKIGLNDKFIFKGHIYLVIDKAMNNTAVYLTGIDNQGIEKQFEFSHDTFLNY